MSGSNRSLNAPISHGEDDSGEWQDWLEDDREAALVVSNEMDVRREMMQQASRRQIYSLNSFLIFYYWYILISPTLFYLFFHW